VSIKIDKEFQSLIPPLTADEFRQLEENILHDGIRDPFVVWPQENGDSILIDGHNRFEISAKHSGIQFKILSKEFKDRDEAKQWIILNQFGRRNLSTYDRSVLALKLKPLIAAEAKERMTLAPHKKAERDKEIQEIWDSYDFDTARNLVAAKKQAYAHEDRAKTTAPEKYIYFARFDSDKAKVGSSVNPDERVKQLSVSCPDISLIEAVPYGEGAAKHENSLKTKYSQYRIGNECYQCSDQVLSEMIAFTRKEAKRKDNTDYKLASIAGVSHDTIHKVETIENSGNEYIKQAVQSGDISINRGYRDIKGLNTKSPRQLHKDYIKSVKQEREEFQEKKDAGIVSVKDVAKDRENAETIAHELWSRLAKAGKPIADIYMEMREQEINIKEMANILTNSETESLKSRIQMWIYQLNQILEVIES
jgi:hypothetical protein